MHRALFLDRDGVINVDSGYVHDPADVAFIEGIFEFCQHMQKLGYLIIIITNQSGIARGIFSESAFQQTMDYILSAFERHGVSIADVFHCPHLSGDDRKPRPGLFLKAQKKWNIDMENSISVGDSERDVVAGQAAGVGLNLLFKGDFNVIRRCL